MNSDFDLKGFWEENEITRADRPRLPIHFWLDDHFLLEGMQVPSAPRYYQDYEYRLTLHREFNDRLERELGKRFYDETGHEAPALHRFEVLMGAHWKYTEGGTPWLESSVENIEDVKALAAKNAKLDMRRAAFPASWQEEKALYEQATGGRLRLGGDSSRGPATMTTSILGTTNTCLFILTDPDVMQEFFRVLCAKLIEYHLALMEATGHATREGYSFFDDNCFLFSPELYVRFCAPFLAKVFAEFAPGPGHRRYQHSDSAMGHLMGILNDLGVNEVNLGPSLHPRAIRKAMPGATIFGQMPPFTLRNGTAGEIEAIVRRDIDALGDRFVECPAGSIVGGTTFANIRAYMQAVAKYGKFQT